MYVVVYSPSVYIYIYLLCPAECVIQGLERSSNERMWRVGVTGNPPSHWDSHRVQSA